MTQIDKSLIKVADMNKDMISQALTTAQKAIDKFQIERQIAKYIKQHFDKFYYPNWHCIVGKNYGSIITYESRHFINFMIGEIAILLFKFG